MHLAGAVASQKEQTGVVAFCLNAEFGFILAVMI